MRFWSFQRLCACLGLVLLAVAACPPRAPAQGTLGFADYVSPDFANTDVSGQAQNHDEFLRSVQSDFKNLDQIQLTINSQNATAAGDLSIVALNWSFRARFRQSGEEWILTNQKSRLTYAYSDEQRRWLLKSISGDPIFGLSNHLGALPVYRGKVDGLTITKENAFGVLAGQLGAGNAALQGFTGLTLKEGGLADLMIKAGSLACADAGNGTRNVSLALTIRNAGKDRAAGTLRVEEGITGIGTLAQAVAVDLAAGAETTFTNGGAPILTGVAPNSVCCAELRVNSDGAIKEFSGANNALGGVKFACP